MKSTLCLLLACALPAAVAGPAQAGEAGARMAVSLSVGETCGVTAAPLEFAIEPDGAAQAQAAVALTCPPQTAYAIALDRGDHALGQSRHMAEERSGATIAYDVYRDAARTARWGGESGDLVTGLARSGPVVHVAYGRVSGGQRIAPGVYRDTLVVTVNF